MLSDIRVGRWMAVAAAQGALANVAINLVSIADADFAARMKSEAQLLKSRIMEQPVGVERP